MKRNRKPALAGRPAAGPKPRPTLLFLLAAGIMWAQAAELAPVISKSISRTIELPGEFQAFQSVRIHARVRGYVERVAVDRGSVVKRGDVLAELTAPEMQAQIAEAESKVQAAESERLQAAAQLAAAQSTSDRLRQAAETPGAIAGNELIQAQKQVEAAQALVESKQQASRAAEAVVRAQKDLEAYLRIDAPFDGVVTERLVHPGALVGPSADPVLLVIQDVSHLRLVVAVPEEDVGGIVTGARVEFRVPAYPERTYAGTVARIAHALDEKTRTMAVELDVFNRDGSLSPGMYPAVQWPIRGSRPLLLVPKTSVVTTTERTFVIRDRNGRAEWVDVRKGSPEGDLIAVAGDLKPGDMVVRRANDEIREGDAMRSGKK
jgi:RND family efflux transporter MFP subunit